MRSRFRRILALIVILVVAAVAMQILLPPAVETYLARAIAQLVPEHESVTVRLHSSPAIGLLQGRMEWVALDVLSPRVQDVAFSWLALRGEEVQVDVPALLERRLHVRRAERLIIEAAWTGEQLTRYVRSQLPQVAGVTVEVLPSAVRVQGGVEVFGRSLAAVAVGSVEPSGTTGIRFVPDEIVVEGVSLPEALVRVIAALLEWHLDLSALPFEVRIESIDVADGYLVAKGAWVTGE